jgi:hypothetical protein
MASFLRTENQFEALELGSAVRHEVQKIAALPTSPFLRAIGTRGVMCRGAVQVCPLQGKCLTNEVVATEVETSTEEKDTYTGLTGGQLKTGYLHPAHGRL